MIQADYEPQFKLEIKEEVYDEDDCIFMDEVDFVDDDDDDDDDETEFSESQKNFIFQQQVMNEDYVYGGNGEVEVKEEEEEDDDDDDEGCLSLNDVLILDNDSEEEESIKLEQVDDDYELKKKQRIPSGNNLKGRGLKADRSLEMRSDLHEDFAIFRRSFRRGKPIRHKLYVQIQDNFGSSDLNGSQLQLSPEFRNVVTDDNDPDIILGELVPPPGTGYLPGCKIFKANCVFKCSKCKYTAPTKHKLKRHYMVHSLARPFTCEVCLKAFRCTSHVREHMRIHTGEKPFRCSICKRAFRRTHHLKRHLSSHAKKVNS